MGETAQSRPAWASASKSTWAVRSASPGCASGSARSWRRTACRLRDALRGGQDLPAQAQSAGLVPALLTAAAFTWANPHVYLDTLGLIGAVSTQYQGAAKAAFALGAIAASFVFFFSLGYGARLLAPAMRSPRAWRRLDLAIAAVMLALAANLLRGLAA
ncbi:LysE/ArgO family amino acid transporter [Mangrovicoccus ximenensis]|uniref:LysE/ArgO family amino acid transporter n=1 Tax=Mangrovicoccus ximenensis TaxID=1911570 RepID=UPI001F024260|nr:LysE family transporter [Mangrovicoccus ximenensis]